MLICGCKMLVKIGTNHLPLLNGSCQKQRHPSLNVWHQHQGHVIVFSLAMKHHERVMQYLSPMGPHVAPPNESLCFAYNNLHTLVPSA